MVVGGEEDVRGMEGETEVNKSEFGMRFHGPQAGLLDHVDRLAQLACALLVTLPRLIPLPWVQLLLFSRARESKTAGRIKGICFLAYIMCAYVGQPGVISYHRPGELHRL